MPLLVLRLQRTAQRRKKQLEQSKNFDHLKGAKARTIGDVKMIEIEEKNNKKSVKLKKLTGKSLNYFSSDNELRRKL